MKHLKKLTALILAIALAFTGAGVLSLVDEDQVITAEAASKVKLSTTKKTVGYKQSFNLSIKNTGSKSVKWSTSNKKVAKITKVSKTKYKVTGVKPGKATITAKVGGKKYKCKVTVSKLSYSTKNIAKGKSFNLAVKSGSGSVKWSTSDKKIASIKRVSGKKYEITGEKKGTATITAKVGKKTYKCKVTVTNPKISKTSKSLTVGNNFNLSVSGHKGTVKWTTSDKSVASIKKVSNNKYKVTGKKTGTATIKAKVDGKTLKCKVTVKKASSSSSGSSTSGSSTSGSTEKTVNGVTFGLNSFPETFKTSSGGSLILGIHPESSINEDDITYKINGNTVTKLCDENTDSIYLPSSYSTYAVYEIGSSWENMVAQVEVYYEKQMYIPWRVEIAVGFKTGSFNVSVYYKGDLIQTCKVTQDRTMDWRPEKIARSVEKEVWTDDAEFDSDYEKMHALEKYINANYTYSELNCTGGASVLYFAARDMGYKNVRFRNVDTATYDYSGTGDVYVYNSAGWGGGHTCVMADYTDDRYGYGWCFEAQGHK